VTGVVVEKVRRAIVRLCRCAVVTVLASHLPSATQAAAQHSPHEFWRVHRRSRIRCARDVQAERVTDKGKKCVKIIESRHTQQAQSQLAARQKQTVRNRHAVLCADDQTEQRVRCGAAVGIHSAGPIR
jgi:hypothetical protein